MIIQPQEHDYLNWIKCVPRDGDLLFFTDQGANEMTDLPFPLLPREQVKAQGLRTWTLNARSWYGYALNQAEYCAWLPTGTIEKLNPAQRMRLAEEQRRLNVPTVFEDLWLTSQTWLDLSLKEQLKRIKLWAIKNEIHSYTSMALECLPAIALGELKNIGYDQLLNRFPSSSGPNCFATAAGAVVKENRSDFYNQWMHWPDLNRLLVELDFVEIDPSGPQPGDVFSFLKEKNPIHAAYYLGAGIFFEKPGQDLYEPYRVDSFSDWKINWPGTQLSIWRKT